MDASELSGWAILIQRPEKGHVKDQNDWTLVQIINDSSIKTDRNLLHRIRFPFGTSHWTIGPYFMTFLINFMIYIENISVINSNIDLRPTSMLGHVISKLGCVFPMVIWSEFRKGLHVYGTRCTMFMYLGWIIIRQPWNLFELIFVEKSKFFLSNSKFY